MRLMHFLVAFVLCSALVAAQGASWQPVPLKYSWDYLADGFCIEDSQCLVNPLYNESLDAQPSLYFQTATASGLPKCIDDSQFIYDHMCVDGAWSSRTRAIAEQLLSIVQAGSLSSYELFCDRYPAALNDYDYFEGSRLVLDSIGTCSIGMRNHDCVNNFCVLVMGDDVAFGVSLNKPIDDSVNSFLYALGESRGLCDNVPDADVFSSCGGSVYYNPVMESMIYYNGSLPASPASRAFFDGLYSDIKPYGLASGFSAYNYTPAFSQLRVGRQSDEFVFSFRHKGAGPLGEQFAGWYFYDFSIPDHACDHYFKRAGNPQSVACYPGNASYYVVSEWDNSLPAKGITYEWSPFMGSMRVVS